MTNTPVNLWLPPILTLLGTLIVVVFTAWLNAKAVIAKVGVEKRLDGLHEDIREIRADVKLLTGFLRAWMAVNAGN